MATYSYINSARAAAFWKTNVVKVCTARKIYDTLDNKPGLRHFRYDGAHSGCLTWSKGLLSGLEGAGIIKKGSTKEFEDWLKSTDAYNREIYWVADEETPPCAKFFKYD